ncbi:MAG: beta-ketoacyl-[acyl-carrier-protein] synthase family protein [Armatimonadetes bacterium]|nr:beta-ketoacyl-[acyl-carrier-protein] synthase family protein [Armatimonadota bacterium]
MPSSSDGSARGGPVRAVVTGLGVVCAIGRNQAEFLGALREGRSGTSRITAYDPSWFNTQVGAEVRDLSFDPYLPVNEQRLLDRQSLLAIAAAAEAVADSGFDTTGEEDRCGVVMGTGMGPSVAHSEALAEVAVNHRKPRPTTIPKCMYNAPSGHLSMLYQCQGPSSMAVAACASSAVALAQALQMIRAGVADAFLTGGTESFPSYALMAAWDALPVMSKRNDAPETASRPFDQERDGFVMGEGAAVLVLESEAHARARGARIYGELAGVGLSSDAAHITRPQQRGPELALAKALADAGLNATDVDYINAHGTATPINDVVESRAIEAVFGPHAAKLMVSSTKSAHGHTIGAAGAIEAAATLLGLHHGFVPPTINFTAPDPECHLDYVPNQAREAPIRVGLSNSFAFGGHNVVLVLRRYDG